MKADGFLDDETQLAPPRTIRIDFDDGSFALRSPVALKPYARCIGEWLERWARETPDALALAERDETGEGWRRLDYRALRRAVGAVAQGLLDLGVPADQPVVILSDNAIDHAVLMLATMHIGRTACSLSSAYSRMAKDPTRLHGMLRALEPALIYASDAKVYGGALAGCGIDAPMVFSRNADAHRRRAALRAAADAAQETPAVMQAFEAILPDDPRQVPADLRLHRQAQGGDQHAPHAVRQPADDCADLALPRRENRRCWSTGCPGATPSAPTTTSTWCCATAARSTSTRAGRRRA